MLPKRECHTALSAADSLMSFPVSSALQWHMYLFSSGAIAFTPPIKPCVRAHFSQSLTFPLPKGADADD